MRKVEESLCCKGPATFGQYSVVIHLVNRSIHYKLLDRSIVAIGIRMINKSQVGGFRADLLYK